MSMSRPKLRSTIRWFCRSFGALAVALLAAAPALAAAVPSLDGPNLGRGPWSSMRMLLQKLVFDVADVDVRFDPQTQARFAQLATGKAYSPDLGHQLALAAIDAKHAVFQTKFKRDVPLNRWVGVVKDDLEQARKAGLITREVEQRVGDSLPQWFGALKDRGYEKGDRLIYAVTPDAVRSVVVSTGGQVLVDRTESGHEGRRVVLGSFFATGSEFREPLLKSMFASK
jgi:hypothetical protein